MEPVWAKLVPTRLRLPQGFEVEFRIVSDSYIKRAYGSCHGVFTNYGDVDIRDKPLPSTKAIIYLNRSMTTEQFLETIGHEMHHALTDWHGRFANIARDELEKE